MPTLVPGDLDLRIDYSISSRVRTDKKSAISTTKMTIVIAIYLMSIAVTPYRLGDY